MLAKRGHAGNPNGIAPSHSNRYDAPHMKYAIALTLCLTALLPAENWPRFRGPNGAGVAKAENSGDTPAENGGGATTENGGDAPAAMETDAAAAAPQKKKKVRRTDAEVNARGSSLPLQELEAYINQENHMRAKDKLSEDTKQARNDLEGYILSARSKLYAEWEAFVAEDARASFSKTLEDTEEWMYEDGEDETREVYVAKMRELQGVGDPIQERCAEDRSRGPACAALRCF